MAKIGTAHIEIKPVINDAALDELCDLITARVRRAVGAALSEPTTTAAEPIAHNGLCTCPLKYGPHPFHKGSPAMSTNVRPFN